jgi:hypothetical protein
MVAGTEVTAGIAGVTSGVSVAGDVIAGATGGKTLNVPDTWRIPRAAMMTMIAITAPAMIFIRPGYGPGNAAGKTTGAPVVTGWPTAG